MHCLLKEFLRELVMWEMDIYMYHCKNNGCSHDHADNKYDMILLKESIPGQV